MSNRRVPMKCNQISQTVRNSELLKVKRKLGFIQDILWMETFGEIIWKICMESCGKRPESLLIDLTVSLT